MIIYGTFVLIILILSFIWLKCRYLVSKIEKWFSFGVMLMAYFSIVAMTSCVKCENYLSNMNDVAVDNYIEDNLSIIYINASCYNFGEKLSPKLKIYVNEKLSPIVSNDSGYTGLINLRFHDINSIMIVSDYAEEDEIFVRSILLNEFKLNSPIGWNVSIDDSIKYLGDTKFLMNKYAKIKFEKPDSRN